MTTGKEMCETIVKADFLRKDDGTAPTADEIWNYSPTGEISMVILWYWEAKEILAQPPVAAPEKESSE